MTGRVLFSGTLEPVPFANVGSMTRPGIITNTDEAGNWSAPFVHGEIIRISQVGSIPWTGQAQDAQGLLYVGASVQELPGATVHGSRSKKWWPLALLIALAYVASNDRD